MRQRAGKGRAWVVYLRSVFVLMTLVACGQSSGCSGCDQEGEPFPDKDRVHSAVQVRLTSNGLTFLEQNLEPILAEVLPEEGLNFCLPGDGGDIIGLVQWGYCQAEMCADGSGENGCNIGIGIGGVDLQAVEPDRLRATVTFDELSARFDIRANPVVDCSLAIDGPGFPVGIDLLLSTPDPTRDLTFTLADPNYMLSDLTIRLMGNGGGLSFLCDAIDAVINFPFIGDFLLDALGGLVEGPIVDLVSGFVEDFTCRSCEDDAGCPVEGGARCDGGRCMLEGACIPAPLGIEGQFDLGDLLSGFSPGLEAQLRYLATPGSYVEVAGGGLSLGMIAGADSEKNRCVPRRPRPDPQFEPPRLESLRGNVDPLGREYEVGIGITQTILDHAFWAVFNSGTLCLAITSETIDALNANIIGAAVPGLRALLEGRNPALAITLSPQEVPIATIGANTTMPDPDDEGQLVLDDPLITLEIPNLHLDFHAYINDRWVRAFTLKADVIVPIGAAFTPDNGVRIILGDLSGALRNLEGVNAEIVGGNVNGLLALLPSLLGGTLNLATESLTDPIELPDIMGYQLNVQDHALTGIDGNTAIGLFANLRRAPADGMGEGAGFSVDTDFEVLDVHTPPAEQMIADEPRAWRRPFVKVAMDAWDGTDDGAEMEYAWRVDDHSWSLFTKAREIDIRSPALFLQGRHTIQVQARRVDDYRTLDLTPAEAQVIIDALPPELTVTQAGAVAEIEVSDLVSADADLRLQVRFDGGDWQDLDGRTVALGDAARVEVQALDEVGNVATAALDVRTDELIGRLPPDAEGGDGGCGGCDVGRGQAPSPLWWAALPLLLLGLGRRRGGKHVTLTLMALAVLALVACDDSSKGKDGNGGASDAGTPDAMPGGPCDGDQACAPNQVCRESDGVCVLVTCLDDATLCDAMTCESGDAVCNNQGVCECEPFCAGGCGEDEYCCLARNACETAPPACAAMNCDAGYELAVTQEGRVDEERCVRTDVECSCVEIDPLPLGKIGRFSDFVVVDGVAWSSAYDDTNGDLVVARNDGVDGFEYTWIDGVPADGDIEGAPSGPRGGIKDRGEDVGRYTSIAAGPDGSLHVAYQDVDNEALKYAHGVKDGDGGHDWTAITLDDAGGAGRWTSISVDARGVPGIAYRVESLEEGEGFVSQVRFVLAKNAAPAAPADWNAPFVLQSVVLPARDPETGSYPEGTGLHTSQTRDGAGNPVVAWYDRTNASLWWSRLEDAGFSAPEQLGGWGHPERDRDMGTNVDLVIDPEGNSHLCLQDGLTDSLYYLSPELGRWEWVDDGVRVGFDDREHSVHVVGEDCSIRFDTNGQPLVVYQDATSQDLVLARRLDAGPDGEGSWTWSVIRGEEATYRGAFGFYAKARVVGPEVWIQHFFYDNTQSPNVQGLELLTRPL